MAQESRRSRQVADQVRQEVSFLIDRKLKDPDKGFVTVTRVKMSPDLKLATIYFSAIGGAEEKEKSKKALNRAAAFLRHELAGRMRTRNTPELRFHIDDTMEYAARINELLHKVREKDGNRTSEPETDNSEES
jgi:ribosome-binding factor A